MRKIVMGMMLGMIAAQASAGNADWRSVATNSHMTLYVDRNSIRSLQGHTRLAWSKSLFVKPTDAIFSSITLDYLNCHDQTMAVKANNNFAANGDVITSQTYPDYALQYAPVPPDSIADIELRAVCATEVKP